MCDLPGRRRTAVGLQSAFSCTGITTFILSYKSTGKSGTLSGEVNQSFFFEFYKSYKNGANAVFLSTFPHNLSSFVLWTAGFNDKIVR